MEWLNWTGLQLASYDHFRDRFHCEPYFISAMSILHMRIHWATRNSSCDSGDIYLQEIQSDVYEMTGIDVSPSLLCHFLKDANLSRQRMQMIAQQRF